MSTIIVEPVPGRLLMAERGRGFVGYRRKHKSEQAEVAHSVPDGHEWILVGAVEVPSTAYYRRALARGDIQLAKAPKPKAEKKESK